MMVDLSVCVYVCLSDYLSIRELRAFSNIYYSARFCRTVIGTLYCAKGNFEFGISRIIKSLDPYDKKLHADTWYYAKRCFLALAESMAKHMLIMKVSPWFISVVMFLAVQVRTIGSVRFKGSSRWAVLLGMSRRISFD
jgi:uncharacterized protein YlbG (UPF0298 family)